MDKCVNSLAQRLLYYFMLAFASTVIFILLTQQIVNEALALGIPEPRYRYMAIILIFFVVIYLFDRLIEGWRISNHICV